MLTIAIETSGKAGSIALLNDRDLLREVELSATGLRHARSLVPEVGHLLKSQNYSPQDVNLIAVSIGPGSFTGLRVGIVCAKTFAYAVGCDIIGVDTFAAIATATPQEINEVWVIEDALRGEIYAGKFSRDADKWICTSEAKLIALETWVPQVGDTPVTGPGVSKHIRELDGLSIIEEQYRLPQARYIARLAEQYYDNGQRSDPWTLLPHYMRRSYAEEKVTE